MSGIILSLLRRTSYDWSSYAASQSATLVLVPSINLSAFREGQLLVRLHSNNIGGGNATLDMQAIASTAEEPGVVFAGPTLGTTASITTGTTAPALLVAGLAIPSTSAIGLEARLRLTLTQGAGGGANRAEVSVDLVLKRDGWPLLPGPRAGEIALDVVRQMSHFERYHVTSSPNAAFVVAPPLHRR